MFKTLNKKMKRIIIIVSLFLLSSCGKKEEHIIMEYTTLTEEEIKCITKNAISSNEPTNIEINGKYYDPDDPNLEKCIKH